MDFEMNTMKFETIFGNIPPHSGDGRSVVSIDFGIIIPIIIIIICVIIITQPGTV